MRILAAQRVQVVLAVASLAGLGGVIACNDAAAPPKPAQASALPPHSVADIRRNLGGFQPTGRKRDKTDVWMAERTAAKAKQMIDTLDEIVRLGTPGEP